jgi:hypothetical protein
METPTMARNSTSDDSVDEIIPSHDLRKVGLRHMNRGLSASRGDLNAVFEARARADVVYCPVCPHPHPVI